MNFHSQPQAYGDAAFRPETDWEDEDNPQPAFPARPRALTLSPDRTGPSMRAIVVLALASWGVLWVAVQIGSGILALIGGAL